MKNQVRSRVAFYGGVPSLLVNEKPFPAAAYMTYLEKYNRYTDFNAAGYRLFSVPVLFAGRWISASTELVPFKKGIFDIKDEPDFSLLDEAVGKILAACPDAFIIPRVNVSMPEWWERENPDCVNVTADGRTCRESFYSEKWLSDCSRFVDAFIRYAEKTSYAPHIIGYQLAGGNTEEWFHFDLNAGYCENAAAGFGKYLQKNEPETEFHGLPDLSGLKKKGAYHGDGYLAAFLGYASFAAASAVCRLAAVTKKACANRVVVGAFYGYSLEVTSPLWGTHALNMLLEDENIDFICSPNSYFGIRDAGADWTEMYPADSVRLHGKMCFQECDIRTHLTVPLGEKAPETDPEGRLSSPIWRGPDTPEATRGLLLKSFARQLVKGNGLWWFDMWGGWYADRDIMELMSRCRELYAESLDGQNRASIAEVAVFADESAYKYMTDCAQRNAAFEQRRALGTAGAPYDIYDISDFGAVYEKYKGVIFLSCCPTEAMKKALSQCGQSGVPKLSFTEDKFAYSESELRAFYKKCGVHIFCDSGDIVYINDRFAAIHAVSAGEKKIRLKTPRTFREVTDGCSAGGMKVSDTVAVHMEKGETKIFLLI